MNALPSFQGGDLAIEGCERRSDLTVAAVLNFVISELSASNTVRAGAAKIVSALLEFGKVNHDQGVPAFLYQPAGSTKPAPKSRRTLISTPSISQPARVSI